MPNFFATTIFNQLSPSNFIALSNRFHLGFALPEDAVKVPGDDINTAWTSMLNQGKNIIREHENPEDLESPMVTRQVGAFQDFLQRLHNLVSGKCDAMRVAQDLLSNGDREFEFPPDFEKMSDYDKGAYVFLHDEEFWESLCDLCQSRNCDSSRLWIEYNNLPAKPPKANDDDLRRLEVVMTSFFRKTRPKTSCHIHNYIRIHQYNYFATLRDNPRYHEGFVDTDGEEKVEPIAYVPPLRIIFVYDERGQFSIFGEMDKKDFDPLAKLLVRELMDYDGHFNRIPKAEYYLEELKRRDFNWKVEAVDCMETPKLCGLTISPVDDEYTRLTLTNHKRSIHDCMDDYLKRIRLTDNAIQIHGASIHMKPVNHPKKIKPFTFRITQTSCGLKNLPDDQRELGEKYVRKLGFIRFPDVSLFDILRAVKSPEAVLSGSYADGLSPELMRHLADIGLLEQVDDAMMVAEEGAVYDVVPVNAGAEEPLLATFGAEGSVHVTGTEELKRYRLVYGEILKCVRDTLGCTGAIEAIIDNLVWKLGLAGSEHRDVLVVRDWDCDERVQDAVCQAKSSSLVFHIGGAPKVIQIGARRSDLREKDDRQELLEVQCYQLDTLMDYTQENGLVFHAHVVRARLHDMLNAVGERGSGGPVVFKKDTYQRRIETWLWTWFDARLKAAKVAAYGDGDDEADVNIGYLDYEILTQKQIVETLLERYPDIPANAFTRTKEVWRSDLTGFGQLYYQIAENFVRRSSRKWKQDDPQSIQRLNDFYEQHKEEIKALRQSRPTGA